MADGALQSPSSSQESLSWNRLLTVVQSVSILLGLGDDLRLSQEKTLPATDRRRLAVFDAFDAAMVVVELVAVVDNEDLRRGRCVSEMSATDPEDTSPLLVRREEDTFSLTADDTDTFAVDVVEAVLMEWIDLRRVEVFI